MRKRQLTVSHILGKRQSQDLLLELQRQGKFSIVPFPPLGATEITAGEVSVRAWKWQCKQWDQHIKVLHRIFASEMAGGHDQDSCEPETAS